MPDTGCTGPGKSGRCQAPTTNSHVEAGVAASRDRDPVLILLFLPALYAAWIRIKPTADEIHEEPELRAAMAAE